MSEQQVYRKSSAPVAERLADLMGLMTLEEKVGQTVQADGRSDADAWVLERHAGSILHVTGDEVGRLQRLAEGTRLGIPLLFGIDAIHGHCFGRDTVVYPTQLALASSFDPETAREIAARTAREVAAAGLHMTFSPVLCLGRDARWGRVDETFGEDPFLAGEMGAAMVQGYQGKSLSDPASIIACAKHYIAYGETLGGRDSSEAEVSERKLRSVFLPPFRRAVEAGVASVMAAYNAVDGRPCSANPRVLRDMLKGELGFKGFVITDWNNLGWLVGLQRVADSEGEAARLALESGNDLIMNTPAYRDAAIALFRDGILPMSILDEACSRILAKKFELGLFDAKRHPAIEITQADRESDRAFAKAAAIRSIILLENRGGALPLGPETSKIAVVGPNADSIFNLLGDWSFGPRDPGVVAWNGNHADATTPLAGIRAAAERRGLSVDYERGCGIMDDYDAIDAAVALAGEADAVICVIGDDFNQNGEGRDRADLDLTGGQRRLVEALSGAGKKLIVVLVNGKPLALPWLPPLCDALVEAWNPGIAGGDALADILFGDAEPEGRLPISWPRHSGQVPVYYNQLPGWHAASYHDLPAGPLYPFGYGLSYASFEYGQASIDASQGESGEKILVSVPVRNTGKRAGTETVQCYVRDLASSVTVPDKWLVGFAKLRLDPGEAGVALIEVPIERLSIVNSKLERVVEPGSFAFLVGPSSASLSESPFHT